MTRRLRIGIDTGGTFTDVVAFDEQTGELTTTKTPSTPDDPAEGFMAGVEKVLGLLSADASAIAISHGTTVATNQLLQGKVGRLGFITTEGYEFVLEIARQSVPDGYGNSYFWVKPDRIVPAQPVKTVSRRLDHTWDELRPFDEAGAVRVARWLRAQLVGALGVCFLHSSANPEHEQRMAAVLAREHPAATVSLSSQVLREYREYERSMTTLLDAAVKPAVASYLWSISERLNQFGLQSAADGDASTATGAGREVGPAASPASPASPGSPGSPGPAGPAGRRPPFYVMKSNGGVLSADEVVHQPITTVLSGPA